MTSGKKTGMIVSIDPQTRREKFASFHDLRQSCALHWAAHLKPQDLMEFTRHTSLQVTLDHNVGERAMPTADRMWQAIEAVG